MADLAYNKGLYELLNGGIDLDTDTIKMALVTSSYTPNIDTHQDYADIANEVANGNGYTTGGATLANPSLTQDDTNDRAVFDCDNPVWSTASFTAAAGIVYMDSGTPATSWFIVYLDFGGDVTSTGDDFTVQIHANGVLYLDKA